MKYCLTPIATFLLLTLFSSFQSPRNEPKDIIYWDAAGKLEWSDFKGQPDSSTSLQALTACNIDANSSFNGDSAEFKIEASFDKNGSWVKTADETPELLRHEQVHFDIAGLHERKLRKAVKESAFSSKTINKDFGALCSRIITDFHKMEEQYDRETNHSMNKVKQAEWEKNIPKELKKLEAYNVAVIKMRIKTN